MRKWDFIFSCNVCALAVCISMNAGEHFIFFVFVVEHQQTNLRLLGCIENISSFRPYETFSFCSSRYCDAAMIIFPSLAHKPKPSNAIKNTCFSFKAKVLTIRQSQQRIQILNCRYETKKFFGWGMNVRAIRNFRLWFVYESIFYLRHRTQHNLFTSSRT